jgi:hypothetical protein
MCVWRLHSWTAVRSPPRRCGLCFLFSCAPWTRHLSSPSHVQWISVLPTGAMGDVVMRCGEHAGVDMSQIHRVAGADVGVFFVLPEQHTVHYQRRHSAFALHDPAIFDWDKV